MVKNLLSIQHPAFVSPNWGEENFGHLGFKVYRVDIGEYRHLEIIERLIKRDLEMSLEDFDAVLIIDAAILPFEEKLLFPSKDISAFKSKLDAIGHAKGKRILFFGMNGSIPSDYYEQQAALFDGLLICMEMPKNKYQEVMTSLSAFVQSE